MVRVLFLWLLAFSAAAQSVISPDDRALYGIINRGSGRCLDVQRAATTGGAALVQWEFTHAPSQQWHLVRIREGSEYYRLEAKHSGLCLTLEVNPATAGTSAATPLVQRTYSGALGQQWQLASTGQPGTFQLLSRLDGRAATLAANDKFNNTAVVAARAVGRSSQQWRLFQLRLQLASGPPYFAAPEPLPALSGSAASSELQPVPAPDGSRLYFTRTRFAGNTEGLTESGDIWLSESADQGRTWQTPTRLATPAGLNTAQGNAVQALVGPASAPALLLRGIYESSGFREEGASRVAGAGGRPAALRIAGYASSSPATGFFMSADEKILLLSLERDDSQGSNDLYLSEPDGAGGYGAPRSLGEVVNSPGYEFAPWLAADGKTLYFASYGHLGYGSADIFVTERLDDTWRNWSAPRNLGPRFNGTGYDAFFALGPDGSAYYATSGPRDTDPKKLRRTPPGTPPVADTATRRPAGSALAQVRATVAGRVLDGRTGQPLNLAGGAEVKATRLGADLDFRSTARADAVGFQMSLAPGRYRFVTTAGLLTRIDTLTVAAGEVRRYEPRLTPATVGSRLDLPDLLFVQGLAQLLPASYPTLNRLAESMKDNPQLEIRLEGHTDNTGDNLSPKPNQVLSEKRVAEVRDYLVGHGVAPGRITTIGYGGSRPKFSNTREETRKLNRRVELVITK